MAEIKVQGPKIPVNEDLLKQYLPDFLKMMSKSSKDYRERAIFFGKNVQELSRAKGTYKSVSLPSHIKPSLIRGTFHTHPLGFASPAYNDFRILFFTDFGIIGVRYESLVSHKTPGQTPEEVIQMVTLSAVKKRISPTARNYWGLILDIPGICWLYNKKPMFFISQFLDQWTLSKDGEWRYCNGDQPQWVKEYKEFRK
ncbi:hypothetical protein MYX07_06690 [Patescibacteria group bacterium AH-259-L07]|nr:hypothetical protein [Patescibacteria group bacterium AH-259-L07]